MAKILTINQFGETTKENPFKNAWEFVVSQSKFTKLTLVAFLLLGIVASAIIGQRFGIKQYATAQQVSLFFTMHRSTTPLTTISVQRGETVLLDLHLNTSGQNDAVNVNGFDIVATLTNNNTFVLSQPGITEGAGSQQFTIPFFNDWANNTWRFGKFNINTDIVITENLPLATIPLTALSEGSGTLQITQAIVTSPDQEDLVVGLQPLGYTVTSPPTATPTPSTIPMQQVISSCREITTTGYYTLQADLTAQSGQTCINIHDTNNVSLNCNNHTISGIIASSVTPAIKIDNAPNFIISNCTVNNQESSPPGQPHRRALIVSNSNGGTITNNILNHNVSVNSSSNLTVSNNTINGFYLQENSSNNTIDNNRIHWHSTLDTGGGGGAFGVLSLGNSLGTETNNRVINNIIDGNSTGVYSPHTGADDGMALFNQTGITVSGNTILNSWDCGIETFDLIKDSTISGNRITKSGYCGIGGWWRSSFIGNTVADNIIDDTNLMFRFSNQYDPSNMFPIGQNVLYFKNNNFTNNQFINPRLPAPITAFEVADFDFVHVIPSMAGKFDLGNNRFTKNNFTTKRPGPMMLPVSMIIDGGGNICNPTSVLPTDPAIPLQCSSTVVIPTTPN